MNRTKTKKGEKSGGNNLKNNILQETLLKLHKKECQASNKVETPDLTNQLRSGKIIPRNGATDVAAFKFYLDEVKYRLSGRYGAGNGGLCRGTEQCPVGTDSDAIRCLASTAGKASYLIVEPLVLRSPGGRGAMQHPRPHQKQEERSCLVSLP